MTLDEDSIDLTTFGTPLRRYPLLCLPFGISPAPDIFQYRRDQALLGLQGTFRITDDILAIGECDTIEEAVSNNDKYLIKLLEWCRTKNIPPNTDKFELCIGHTLHSDGLKPDFSKVQAIIDVPNIDSEIIDYIPMCNIWRTLETKQAKERLISHDVQNRPWSKIETDIFTHTWLFQWFLWNLQDHWQNWKWNYREIQRRHGSPRFSRCCHIWQWNYFQLLQNMTSNNQFNLFSTGGRRFFFQGRSHSRDRTLPVTVWKRKSRSWTKRSRIITNQHMSCQISKKVLKFACNLSTHRRKSGRKLLQQNSWTFDPTKWNRNRVKSSDVIGGIWKMYLQSALLDGRTSAQIALTHIRQ